MSAGMFDNDDMTNAVNAVDLRAAARQVREIAASANRVASRQAGMFKDAPNAAGAVCDLAQHTQMTATLLKELTKRVDPGAKPGPVANSAHQST